MSTHTETMGFSPQKRLNALHRAWGAAKEGTLKIGDPLDVELRAAMKGLPCSTVFLSRVLATVSAGRYDKAAWSSLHAEMSRVLDMPEEPRLKTLVHTVTVQVAHDPASAEDAHPPLLSSFVVSAVPLDRVKAEAIAKVLYGRSTKLVDLVTTA